MKKKLIPVPDHLKEILLKKYTYITVDFAAKDYRSIVSIKPCPILPETKTVTTPILSICPRNCSLEQFVKTMQEILDKEDYISSQIRFEFYRQCLDVRSKITPSETQIASFNKKYKSWSKEKEIFDELRKSLGVFQDEINYKELVAEKARVEEKLKDITNRIGGSHGFDEETL